MTTFDDECEDFCIDEWMDLKGEPATYLPKNNGTPRSITVIVDRRPLEPQKFAGNSQGITVPHIVVKARNNATTGITSAEIDSTDQIEIPLNKGETATTRRIAKKLGDTGGLTSFQVQ